MLRMKAKWESLPPISLILVAEANLEATSFKSAAGSVEFSVVLALLGELNVSLASVSS